MMGINKPSYFTSKKEIYGDIEAIRNRAFYQDLMMYLDAQKDVAMNKLKNKENEEARATWKFIDKLVSRYDNIEKEVKQSIKIK